MDSLVQPFSIGILPLILNFFWPGLGTCIDSYFGPNGFDIKTFAFGLVIQFLYFTGWWWWWLLIPAILIPIAWILGIYHGYLVYKKSSWTDYDWDENLY